MIHEVEIRKTKPRVPKSPTRTVYPWRKLAIGDSFIAKRYKNGDGSGSGGWGRASEFGIKIKTTILSDTQVLITRIE